MIAVSHRFPQLLPLFPTQSQKTIHFKKIHVEKRSDSHSENNTTALHKILVRQKQVDKFLLKNEKRTLQLIHVYMPFLLLIRRKRQVPCHRVIRFFCPTKTDILLLSGENRIQKNRSYSIFLY